MDLAADIVSLNILSSLIIDLKSWILRGALFNTIRHRIPALLAASTPNGALSITNAFECGTLILFNTFIKDEGSGLPFPLSSAVIKIKRFPFPKDSLRSV